MKRLLLLTIFSCLSVWAFAGADPSSDASKGKNDFLPPLVVTGVVNQDTCEVGAGSIDLTVSGGIPPYTYSWSNGANTEDITGLIGNMSYTVTIMDTNGNIEVQDFYVSNLGSLVNLNWGHFYTWILYNNTVCVGPPNGGIDLTPLGSLPFMWIWENGVTTPDNLGLSGGDYDATITLGSCSSEIHTGTFVFNEPNAPQLAPIPTAATCGLPNGSIDLTITESEPPYTIVWSNGANTEDISNLAPGTYTVTVTGVNGCSEVESYTIVDEPSFTLSGDVDAVSSCLSPNGSIDLTLLPSGSYTFQWNNGTSTEDISGLSPGTYAVTATDGNGCTSTASFTVDNTAQPPTLATAATSLTCGLGSGGVDLTASGGTAPYTYSWSNGAGSEDLSGVPAATYTVTVIGANGCSATASAIVADNAVNIGLTGAVAPNTNCTGNNGTVNLSVSPAPPPVGSYTFAWSSGASSEDLSGLAPGSYTVTVSLGSCSANASFTVADQPLAPAITAAIGPDVCGGTSGSVDLTVSGGAAPFTFSWGSGQSSEDLNGLAAGNYAVTVTGANGCTSTYGATVPAEDLPLQVNGATAPNTSCTAANGSITTSITPALPPVGMAYAYQWDTGEQTPGLTGLGAGNYVVTVTLGTGCTASASFTVESGPQLPALSASATPAGCGSPGSVSLTVTGGTAPYDFLWSNMATTEDLPSVPPGSYAVTVTGADGCSATASATVQNNGTGADTTAISATTCDPNGAGTFTQNLTGQGGCDSVVITTVSLLASDTTELSGTSCDINEVGTFEETLVNGNGCDSLIITTITYAAADTTDLFNTSCDINDVGVFELTLTNGNGCDSLIITTITYAAADTTSIFDTSCDVNDVGVFEETLTNGNGCDSLIITTITYAAADTTELSGTSCDINDVGVFEQTFTNSNGCDSLIVTTITYAAADTTSIFDTSCDIIDVGVFVQALTNINGCDSLIITTITYAAADTTAIFDTSCDVNEVGTFEETLVNGNGCDSLIITTITYAAADTTALFNTSCDVNDVGVFEQTLTNGNGCDSLIITTITYAAADTTIISGTSCDINSVGVFEETLVNSNGCDSVVITTATLLPSTTTTLAANTCDAAQAGVFIQNLNTWQGCDSTVTTTVTLLPSTTTSLASNTYDAAQAGVFIQNLSTWQGCDSIVTTTVGLLPDATTNLLSTTCDPTAAGVFIQNLSTWQGCDSTVTTTVALLPNVSTDLSATTCDPTQAGVFVQNLTNWQGCDSTVNTTITWTPPPTLTLAASDFSGFGTSCTGASDGWAQASATGVPPFGFVWADGTQTPLLEGLAPGVYPVTVTDGNGCTSASAVEITGPEPLATALGITALACFDDGSGAVTASGMGGVPPYQYSLGAGPFQSSGTFGGLGAGAYQITVQDANGCSATDLVAINAPVPLSVELGDDVFLELGDGTALSALVNVPLDSLSQINWSGLPNLECPQCPQQQVFPVVTTAYTVTVADAQGCIASDGVTVFVDRRKNVYVPNAFSPDGDGINDLLTIFAKEGQVKQVKSFLVFDRWGESVFRYFDFQPNDPAIGWDGTHRGLLLDAAVFVWFAEVEFVDGKVELFEGDVVLMR